MLIPFICDCADVLSASLDAGTAVGLIIIYFSYVGCFLGWLPRFFLLIELYMCRLQYPYNGKIGEHTIKQWCA